MKLRGRLLLTFALTIGPFVAGFAYLRTQSRDRGAATMMAESVVLHMEYGGRARCEAAPARFREAWGTDSAAGGIGPADARAFPLFAYSPAFVSQNIEAPPFPADLRAALERGESAATRVAEGEGAVRLLAVRLPWAGPCALALARFPMRMRPGAAFAVAGPGLVVAGVLLVVLAVAGPMVARIRRLTAEVRRSADTGYANVVAVLGKDEIAELAGAFNAAAAQVRAQVAALQKRDEALRAFVANTTHDVAIPLTVLQGHLTSVRARLDAGEPVDRTAVCEAIEEAHYLGSLLHNLGAAAKLDATDRELERHPVDLNRVVERAVARHRSVAAQRGISLDFAVPEPPLFATGDITLVEQALSNVVHNAVHYNADGGHVGVLLDRTHAPHGPGFSLRVMDDGPGVPEADIPHLTERGYRSPQGRQSLGHGLGLHIAHEVAARHSMKMEIRRSSHGGLEVEFTGAEEPRPRSVGA